MIPYIVKIADEERVAHSLRGVLWPEECVVFHSSNYIVGGHTVGTHDTYNRIISVHEVGFDPFNGWQSGMSCGCTTAYPSIVPLSP